MIALFYVRIAALLIMVVAPRLVNEFNVNLKGAVFYGPGAVLIIMLLCQGTKYWRSTPGKVEVVGVVLQSLIIVGALLLRNGSDGGSIGPFTSAMLGLLLYGSIGVTMVGIVWGLKSQIEVNRTSQP